MTEHDKTYLGDGVYVTIEVGMIKLTTSNGIRDTNTIYMEPKVLALFREWCDRLLKQAEEAEK